MFLTLSIIAKLNDYIRYKKSQWDLNEEYCCLINELNTLEEDMSFLYSKIKSEKSKDALRKSQIYLNDIQANIGHIEYSGKLKERIDENKEEIERTENLEQILNIAKNTIVKEDLRERDLVPISNLLKRVSTVCSLRNCNGFSYEDMLKNFEKKYSNTNISKESKKIRLKYFTEKNDFNISSYLFDVYYKLDNVIPDYTPNPNGIILKNPKKWRTKISNKNVKGKYGFFNTKLEIECEYLEEEPSIEDLANISKKNKNSYKAYCLVFDDINENLKQKVKNFENPNLGLFAYGLQSKEFIENKEDKRAHFFRGYFNPKSKPKKLKKLIYKNSKDGVISLEKLEDLGISNVTNTFLKEGFFLPLPNNKFFLNNLGGE